MDPEIETDPIAVLGAVAVRNLDCFATLRQMVFWKFYEQRF